MHIVQGTVILTICGGLTNYAGAYVLPHEEAPVLPPPIQPIITPNDIPVPFMMDRARETGTPSVASPVPLKEICCTPTPPKAICCTPGCNSCSTRSCVSDFCTDLPFSSCCAEEFLAEAEFFDRNMTKLDVTYADLGDYLAEISGDLDGGDKVN